MSENESFKPKKKNPKGAVTRVFLRGLSISLPPILTLVILIWIGSVFNQYIIHPISDGVRYLLATAVHEIHQEDDLVSSERLPAISNWGNKYRVTTQLKASVDERQKRNNQPITKEQLLSTQEQLLSNDSHGIYVLMEGGYVPLDVYQSVEDRVGPRAMPRSAIGAYKEFVSMEYFKYWWHLSAFAMTVAVIMVYFVGRVVTARLGAWAVQKTETTVLARVPLVSNVYSSVKQVTDFLLTEHEVDYRRVVAIEYPRRGIWSLGLVTGDSMLEITTAAGEPLVSVLIPSSPMPLTGYTMSVPRSEVVDLNISVDQAFQFCISCGVLVPPNQKVTLETLQQAFGKQFPPSALPSLSEPTKPNSSETSS